MEVNGFVLEEDVYICKTNKRPCKRFKPPIDLHGKQYWWVQYLEGDRDVTLIHHSDLEKLKYGTVLYMEWE